MFAITMPCTDGKKAYTIRKVADAVWVCDCPDHVNRAHGNTMVCKHIAEITRSLAEFAVAAKTKSKRAEEILAS